MLTRTRSIRINKFNMEMASSASIPQPESQMYASRTRTTTRIGALAGRCCRHSSGMEGAKRAGGQLSAGKHLFVLALIALVALSLQQIRCQKSEIPQKAPEERPHEPLTKSRAERNRRTLHDDYESPLSFSKHIGSADRVTDSSAETLPIATTTTTTTTTETGGGSSKCNQNHRNEKPAAQQQTRAGRRFGALAQRQQRQYSKAARLIAPTAEQHSAQVNHQPEEFSLSAPSSTTGASIALEPNSTSPGSGYTILESNQQAASATTLSGSNDGASTTSAPPPNRPNHSVAGETAGSLSAAATATATATSIAAVGQAPALELQPAQQQASNRQHTGRRMDELAPSNERHASHPALSSTTPLAPPAESEVNPTKASAQLGAASQPQSISSSPSSVSIITPLIGPQQQHSDEQAKQSTMMRPIFVVGQPLGESDYAASSAGHKERGALDEAPAAAPASDKTVRRVDEQLVASSNALAVAETERMSGPALVYADGHLQQRAEQQQVMANSSASAGASPQSTQQQQQSAETSQQQQQQQPAPRLFQGPSQQQQQQPMAAVLTNSPRRPSLPPPVNQANAASGFRSPLSPSGPLLGQPSQQQQQQQQQQQPPLATSALQQPLNSLQHAPLLPNFYQTAPPYAGGSQMFAAANSPAPQSGSPLMVTNKQTLVLSQQQQQQQQQLMQLQYQQQQQQQQQQLVAATTLPATASTGNYPVSSGRRPLNITRVEHISAECSNDLIRAVIVFNGTFKGIIYSSGYVNDPTCMYVNGTGSTRYEFSIRLNQCGTLGRQELHQPTSPGEARRRDQVMWNTLSIQYNPVIEQEWDEHFRVSCEYGSDFWKTVSFSPFNVETNTGSPVVFTINPPQCQMDVLLGHGMGPKIAVDGPVTVGDPLTLLIHMKSEKAGYDILVKNCIAHNGGKQRMQLIDSNGCVVNERFISPFRGTYNDNDLRHVTLYAYLKAFRFTGSPVLYLECEIHMCQSACPPQMCYWRRLSKRSVDNSDFEYTEPASTNGSAPHQLNAEAQPIISDSLSLFKALQVRHEPIEPEKARQRAQQLQEIYAEDDESQLVCYRHAEVLVFMATIGSLALFVLSMLFTCCWRIRNLTRLSERRHQARLDDDESTILGQRRRRRSQESSSTLSLADSCDRLVKHPSLASPNQFCGGGGGGSASPSMLSFGSGSEVTCNPATHDHGSILANLLGINQSLTRSDKLEQAQANSMFASHWMAARSLDGATSHQSRRKAGGFLARLGR